MRELFFIILAWGRLKTDTKPRSYIREMLATLTTQNFKRYLPCRTDTRDKVKDKLGKISNIPDRQRAHFLSRNA